jgi:predicted RNase H-like HicB family nuclease
MPYDGRMLRYHVPFHLPRAAGEMVVAEALDFPGAVTQGFDLADARLMIASAREDLAQCLLEEGRALPSPDAVHQESGGPSSG